MNEQTKRGSYAPLWILIALCAFPYIGGTLYYQYWKDDTEAKTSNYGTLVNPVQEVKDIHLTLVDGSEKDITDYRKKWLMLYVLDADCAEDCQKNLYFMRQIRKAMAQDRFRISRLLILKSEDLITDEFKKVLNDYPGIEVATIKVDDQALFYSTIQSISGNIFGKIMLIDPLGNYMMEYPKEPDPKKVLKDVKRLLSVSRVG